MNRIIDLRSDTVTTPTAEMRRAMAEAEVGDDVYGEDPTVNRLEQRAAEILGKQAGLFVPTGTMGNTVAIKIHTDHGQEVICDARAHILDWELSMTAWFSGCLVRTVETSDGILRWDAIQRKIRVGGPHCAPTALIEVENTHNMAGGTVYPVDTLREIYDNSHEQGLKVHMDGARIFNASAASGVPVAEYAKCADTVMFCLSKGLGAPAGSMVVGTADDIAKGRLYRKRLGGGMRQVGVLAAAGLIALEKMPARLHEDHENARFLAGALSRIPGVQTSSVETNILMVDVSGTGVSPASVSRRLKAEGVLMNPTGPAILRAVTHYDVGRADCERASEIFGSVVRSVPVGAVAG
jgi:threonine aldolase